MRESSVLDETNEATSPVTAGLETLRTAAGWMPLTETAWIAVTGDDRVRWLNGMVTNSVQALAPGEGAYAFLLNAQGRIQGDTTVWAEPDRLLLQTGRAQAAGMAALLDRFIIMDDVELVERQRWGLAVAGPAAEAMLRSLGLAPPGEDLRAVHADWNGHPATLLRAYSPVVPRFEAWFDEGAGADAFTALLSSEPETPAGSFELLRVLEERPGFAADGSGDLRDRDLPQETAQMRALHFNKGCYLGQEIVERIRSRGQVHRTFASFTLRGDVPPPGTELFAEGKPVGMLTTVATAPIDGKWLALGFARREALERGSALAYTGGTAEARGRISASKF